MMQLELAFLQGCCSSGHGQGTPSPIVLFLLLVLFSLLCSSLYDAPSSMVLLPPGCFSLQGAPPSTGVPLYNAPPSMMLLPL